MNVEQVSKEILVRSSILSDMLDNNEIMIAGGIYSVSTGEVNFY
jgi:carbonic anhydrase